MLQGAQYAKACVLSATPGRLAEKVQSMLDLPVVCPDNSDSCSDAEEGDEEVTPAAAEAGAHTRSAVPTATAEQPRAATTQHDAAAEQRAAVGLTVDAGPQPGGEPVAHTPLRAAPSSAQAAHVAQQQAEQPAGACSPTAQPTCAVLDSGLDAHVAVHRQEHELPAAACAQKSGVAAMRGLTSQGNRRRGALALRERTNNQVRAAYRAQLFTESMHLRYTQVRMPRCICRTSSGLQVASMTQPCAITASSGASYRS